MTRRSEQEADLDTGVLPAWVRYPVIVVAVSAVLVGLIIAMYERGVLPLVGPFVAVIVASTLVYLLMYARSRRFRTVSAHALTQLRSLTAELQQELCSPASSRATGAADESLRHAAELAELALQRFSWGHDQGAAPYLLELGTLARDSWRPEAPLTRRAHELAEAGAELSRVADRMNAAAERRPADRP